ncbi:MAG: DUF4333 domain-containing protein [Nocardioides sp.]|nr:DUF4333 domain-containing protein [Nocardioides sp.]
MLGLRAGAAVAAAVVVTALGLAGCSGSVSVGGDEPVVDRAEVEEQARTQLGRTVGREPEDVTCPGNLTGELGETMRCSLTDSGTTLGVTITVTGVERTDVQFDIDVDEAPAS